MLQDEALSSSFLAGPPQHSGGWALGLRGPAGGLRGLKGRMGGSFSPSAGICVHRDVNAVSAALRILCVFVHAPAGEWVGVSLDGGNGHRHRCHKADHPQFGPPPPVGTGPPPSGSSRPGPGVRRRRPPPTSTPARRPSTLMCGRPRSPRPTPWSLSPPSTSASRSPVRFPREVNHTHASCVCVADAPRRSCLWASFWAAFCTIG